MNPVLVDLYCGLGGWTEGFMAEGYECRGYDIEAHDYGTGGYPGTLILRDVRSIHGSELKDAAVIVGSSPCQEFSYRAMPWSRAKALPPPILGIELFQAQFRIQREASEAAGRHIPLIVENVRGAQKWVGKARWHYGSFYLWGDVPALMPMTLKAVKWGGCNGKRFDERPKGNVAMHREGTKFSQSGAAWFDGKSRDKMLGDRGPAAFGSRTKAREAASAAIAKIPFPLALHIARTFKPVSA